MYQKRRHWIFEDVFVFVVELIYFLSVKTFLLFFQLSQLYSIVVAFLLVKGQYFSAELRSFISSFFELDSNKLIF